MEKNEIQALFDKVLGSGYGEIASDENFYTSLLGASVFRLEKHGLQQVTLCEAGMHVESQEGDIDVLYSNIDEITNRLSAAAISYSSKKDSQEFLLPLIVSFKGGCITLQLPIIVYTAVVRCLVLAAPSAKTTINGWQPL